jgi:hypothetical protein
MSMGLLAHSMGPLRFGVVKAVEALDENKERVGEGRGSIGGALISFIPSTAGRVGSSARLDARALPSISFLFSSRSHTCF